MSDSKKDEIEPSENPKISKKDGAEFYEMYSKYNDILRTWFVAFGLGGLYLLLTNKELITYLKLHKVNGTVEICFLIGVASQIIIALINKFFNWIIYFSTISKKGLIEIKSVTYREISGRIRRNAHLLFSEGVGLNLRVEYRS